MKTATMLLVVVSIIAVYSFSMIVSNAYALPITKEASGSDLLCRPGWDAGPSDGHPINTGICGVSGNPYRSYGFDFDFGIKSLTVDGMDFQKSDTDTWNVTNGASQIDTTTLASDFDSVYCGPADGRAYSTTATMTTHWPATQVICLRTAGGVYVKYNLTQYSCDGTACGDAVVQWEVTDVPDTTPPVVAVGISPESPLTNQDVSISASATDGESTVSSIKIYLDSSLVRACSNTYSCSYTQTGGYAVAGSHTYFATATSTGGTSTDPASGTKSFSVQAPLPSSGSSPGFEPSLIAVIIAAFAAAALFSRRQDTILRKVS